MADGKVDGVTASPDQYGIIQGNGGAVDKLAGSSSNDMLQGHAAFNQYYGGAGDDTFKLVAKFANAEGTHQGVSTVFADQFAYITDFQGAGVSGGDFVNFTGFDASSLELTKVGGTNASGTMYYYNVTDLQGHVFNFQVNSVNGAALGAGDFGFY
ncbi:hypothetical protein [Sphingomonas solaris]|uniref:Calcium-binding protein n=1 Tax=Alterirhizorhabdus solaris TaxID=2529389 RepID=A0A558QS49_9SPHN|nr:hypothetical protein [Sphingomonas solaris]TVV69971.1 hypothetical protein FOY91_20300 [Sphingomonas solaris]